MENKRYSIVRVDNNCPVMQENLDFSSCSKMFNCDKFIRCEKCEHNCRYGDTKEQLIKKIAQVLFKEKIKNFIKLFGEEYLNKSWKQIYSKEAYEQAKEIVEFLGVE